MRVFFVNEADLLGVIEQKEVKCILFARLKKLPHRGEKLIIRDGDSETHKLYEITDVIRKITAVGGRNDPPIGEACYVLLKELA